MPCTCTWRFLTASGRCLSSNHLRQYLPTLIALAANSPYWPERDTGYASWRTMVWNRWPVAGPPPYFTSAAHYDELVATLFDAAPWSMGRIFWDIRPSARFPTIEVRAADVPMTAQQSALLAMLVRALVAGAIAQVDRGDPGPVLPAEMLRLAYWRAARDGLNGHGVDVHTGHWCPRPSWRSDCWELPGRCWRISVSLSASRAGCGSSSRAGTAPRDSARPPRGGAGSPTSLITSSARPRPGARAPERGAALLNKTYRLRSADPGYDRQVAGG